MGISGFSGELTMEFHLFFSLGSQGAGNICHCTFSSALGNFIVFLQIFYAMVRKCFFRVPLYIPLPPCLTWSRSPLTLHAVRCGLCGVKGATGAAVRALRSCASICYQARLPRVMLLCFWQHYARFGQIYRVPVLGYTATSRKTLESPLLSQGT